MKDILIVQVFFVYDLLDNFIAIDFKSAGLTLYYQMIQKR